MRSEAGAEIDAGFPEAGPYFHSAVSTRGRTIYYGVGAGGTGGRSLYFGDGIVRVRKRQNMRKTVVNVLRDSLLEVLAGLYSCLRIVGKEYI